MTVIVDTGAEHIARRIASTIDPVFAMIDGWRDVLEAELGGPLADALTGSPEPRASALDPISKPTGASSRVPDSSLLRASSPTLHGTSRGG
jgi:hypothetical protein